MMKIKATISFSILLLLQVALLQLSVAGRELSSIYSLHGGRDSGFIRSTVMDEPNIMSVLVDVVAEGYGGDGYGLISSTPDTFLQLRGQTASHGAPAADDHDRTGHRVRDLFIMFQEWMSKHNKAWRSIEDMKARFDAFIDNHRYVEARNEQLRKEGSGYRVGLNGFAHLTFDEFRRGYLQGGGYVDHAVAAGQRRQQRLQRGAAAGLVRDAVNNGSFMYGNATDLPQNVDWRKTGALTGVKDQGQCGSGWAFSTVATVEAAHQIATGELVSLSEQELVDCDSDYNQGCNGGLMDYAFQFILSNGGLDTEQDYPYTHHAGRCNVRKRNKHVISIHGYEDVPESDEEALLKAVAHQPVSVAIDAEDRDFQLYHGGVFTGSCGKSLNHAVVAVGYGEEENGQRYWLVRNSWGEDWGEAGYVKMARIGSKDPDGICGINMEPSYPVIIHAHQSKLARESAASSVVERFIRPLLPLIFVE